MIPRQWFSINLSVSDFIWHELTLSEIILCSIFLWINQCKWYANWIRLNLVGRWFLYCSNTDCNSTCCELAVNMCLCVCVVNKVCFKICVCRGSANTCLLRSVDRVTRSVNNIIPTRIMSNAASVFVLWVGLEFNYSAGSHLPLAEPNRIANTSRFFIIYSPAWRTLRKLNYFRSTEKLKSNEPPLNSVAWSYIFIYYPKYIFSY